MAFKNLIKSVTDCYIAPSHRGHLPSTCPTAKDVYDLEIRAEVNPYKATLLNLEEQIVQLNRTIIELEYALQ